MTINETTAADRRRSLVGAFIARHSRERLAADCSVSVATVRGWESGEVLPSAINALRLAQVLGVEVEEILGVSP